MWPLTVQSVRLRSSLGCLRVYSLCPGGLPWLTGFGYRRVPAFLNPTQKRPVSSSLALTMLDGPLRYLNRLQLHDITITEPLPIGSPAVLLYCQLFSRCVLREQSALTCYFAGYSVRDARYPALSDRIPGPALACAVTHLDYPVAPLHV